MNRDIDVYMLFRIHSIKKLWSHKARLLSQSGENVILLLNALSVHTIERAHFMKLTIPGIFDLMVLL